MVGVALEAVLSGLVIWQTPFLLISHGLLAGGGGLVVGCEE